MFFRRRSRTAEEPRNQAASAAGSEPRDTAEVVREVKQLQRELAGIVARANVDGGRLPPGAVPTVRDIDDVLRPLLRYIEVQSASEEEMRHLTAIIHEYLPQALGDFTALPAQYTERPGVTGTTPAEDLIRQLQLLDEGANELQDLVYTGDAAKLAIQARFLDAKFRRSDLDS
ncbi:MULTISPECIES: hypothetical protein [Protofrankia]|uniref:Uncharacterized protein n=1 Tax=Candidatus Protofrankia datiscae TaxID=2716812 RepID=F8B4I1_9ACTN|nr:MULTISPECIES: hypothetical protein [Protofrankia]AEH07922.1 hypothetical protein FsymDg_0354 [Candidatus Protofrankia datiscae]